MNMPLPDDTTLNGALHMLVDVVSGQVAQMDPSMAAAIHAQIDVKFPAAVQPVNPPA